VLNSRVSASLYSYSLTTIVTPLTVHDGVIKSLLRGAPCLDLALGPASARAGPDQGSAWVGLYFLTCDFPVLLWMCCCAKGYKLVNNYVKKMFVM